MRAQHESRLLNLAESVKYSQWQEAIKAEEALEQSLANAGQRYTYYQKLLGTDRTNLPAVDQIDADGLQNLSFSQSETTVQPQMDVQEITVDISQNAPSLGDGEIKTLTSHETEELSKLADANSDRKTASIFDHLGGFFAIIPNFSTNMEPLGTGVSISVGGSNYAAAMSFASGFYKSEAESETYEANKTGKLAGYQPTGTGMDFAK